MSLVYLFLATSIAAVTEFLKRINDKDYRGAIVITVAALLGLVVGVFHVEGISIINGVIAGLGVSGIHTIAKQIG